MIYQYRNIMTPMYIFAHIYILRRKWRGIEPQGIYKKVKKVLTISDSYSRLSDNMNRLKQIEKQIQRIKKQLMALGELRPGSLSKQYNICGKAACRCKDPKAPKRHGPYYQISYGRKGKSSSAFVRPESLADVKKQLANYKRLMELISLWIDLGLEHSKIKLKSVCKKPERSNP